MRERKNLGKKLYGKIEIIIEKVATNYDELFSMVSILDAPVFSTGE